MPLETIKEMDLFEGNAEKQLDLEEALRILPNVKCTIRAYTMVPDPDNEDEFLESEKLCASDLVKIEFRIEYLNLHMDDREGYVHTRNFPYLKKHTWHFMLVDGGTKEKIFHLSQKMRVEERKGKAKRGEEDDTVDWDGSIYQLFTQRIGRAGEYPMELHVLSDSYIGFDCVMPFTLKLEEDPTDIKEFEYSKEDKLAIQGSTGIQSLFAEEDGGFDSDSDEDKEDKKLSETEKLKKRLEDAGMHDAFSGREGSGVVRPKFDTKGKVEQEKKPMKMADGRVEGEDDSDSYEDNEPEIGSD